MKNLTLPIVAVMIMGLWALVELVRMPSVAKEQPDIYGFGRLPVLLDGRIQPIDSTARNAMRVIRHKSTGRYARTGTKVATIPAIEWLLELAAKPSVARSRPVFRIDNEEIKDNLRLAKDEKHFSVNDITADDNFERLARESGRIHSKDAGLRTPYEKSLKAVADSLMIYQRLAKSFRPQNSTDFAAELARLETVFPEGMAAVRAHDSNAEHDESKHQEFSGLLDTLFDPSLRDGDRSGVMFWPRVVPVGKTWQSLSTNLLSSISTAAAAESDWKIQFHPAAKAYAGMVSAYAKDDGKTFNVILRNYQDYLRANGLSGEINKTGKEFVFNNFDPFYKCEILYVLAFLLACG
ncbi:MAG: hypothetical protein QGG00_08625, partial [Verrucomicrobiota bacterium]|nr:hypothetical protein [Verrucomicrobiota bacterium]